MEPEGTALRSRRRPPSDQGPLNSDKAAVAGRNSDHPWPRFPSPSLSSASPARASAAARYWSWQEELIGEPREVAFPPRPALTAASDGRLPARRLILVDDHRSYSLVEVVPPDDAGHDAKFGTHALGEIQRGTAPHLRKRDLQARRRFRAYQGGSAGRKAGFSPALSASSAARMSSILSPPNRRSIAVRCRRIGPSPAG